MALDITRLSGGNTPADGSDPRTFPAIWNATSDALEADVIPTDVTSPATGQLLQYNGTNWVNVGQADAGAIPVFADAAARTSAIPSPSEGMVTYLSDVNQVQAFTGSAFTPVGGILQVVSTTKTDTFSTASATFTAVTGLTATITPTSSSSKILIQTFVQIAPSGQDNAATHLRLSGGNSGGFVGDASSDRVQAIGSIGHRLTGFFNVERLAMPVSVIFLDSPATTSAVTYGVEVRGGTVGTAFVNRSGHDTDNASSARLASSITVMEVAG